MGAWPPITDPELLARMGLDDDGFLAFVRVLAGAAGHRPCGPTEVAHALAYPWERPTGSYLLRGEDVTPLAGDAELAPLIAGRSPLVAIGSNGAPAALIRKFAHFSAADRDVTVLTGDLHDVDVAPMPTITLYGSMPATLIPSPGTVVRAALLWLTPAQVAQLTWSEISYRLGRLEQARFVADHPGVAVDDVFAYVSRLGAFAPEGERLALAAIPARGRTARACTQEELLVRAAGLALGDGDAAAAVHAAFADFAGLVETMHERLWPVAVPFPADGFTPMPAG